MYINKYKVNNEVDDILLISDGEYLMGLCFGSAKDYDGYKEVLVIRYIYWN